MNTNEVLARSLANYRPKITAEELRDFLRQFRNLDGCEVTWRSDAERLYTPTQVVICGFINIMGNPQFWEVGYDLMRAQSREDLMKLVDQLHRAFDDAAAQLRKGVAPQG